MAYLRRKLDDYLRNWRAAEERYPLIVRGARQVGKTASILEFARQNYEHVVYINFVEQPAYRQILADGYGTAEVIRNISRINPEFVFAPGTLLVFDEMQAFPDMATTLKFFKLDGRFDVICSGSLLGLNYHAIESNSVGYKTDVTLHSLDFEEFLWAKGYDDDFVTDMLSHMVEERPFRELEHRLLHRLFLDYCILGGMPAVVRTYIDRGTFEGTLAMQRQLLLDYEEDIRKYAVGLDQGRILRVFRQIPVQLARENKKFQISKVARGARFKDYFGCIEWLADAGLYTLTTTYPAPGEKEKVDAALKEKLAAIKASMSEEELQAIIEETNAAPKDEDTAELMAKIKAVTVESLPEEIKTYAVSDFTDDNGLRHIEAAAGVDGIGAVSLWFDAAALPQEDIHWMRLYTRLLGQLDTDKHTKEELDVLITRYLYNKTTGVSGGDMGDTNHPYMVAEWYALDDDLAAGYDLMEELLFHTRFDDVQKLTEQVQAQKTSVRGTINQSAYQVMLYRGLADRYPFYRYYSYLNFLDYYAFLENLEAMLNEAPEEVIKHFEAVQSFFANNAGAVAGFAGNEQSIEKNRPLADAFMAKLDHVEREAVAYDLPIPSAREALIIDGNIQFNNVIATADDMGLDDFDAGLSAITSLLSDKILVPVLRDQMGVYTPWNSVMDNGSMYLISYRDPNVKETFDVYASLADTIEQLDVDQDTLDGYIMSAYSGLALPAGELAGAVTAIEDTLFEQKLDRNLDYMRQLKAVTPETVKAAAEIYRKAWENGVHSTAGSASAINANADLYDVILNPFNAQDASQVEFTDAAEGSESYEAVRFAFENGLMTPKADDAFGTGDPATAGDFYGAIYVLIGGAPGAVDEAMATLAQYGLVPEGVEAATELTLGDCAQLFGAVTAALGAPFTPDVEAGTEDQTATRGQLAQMLQTFTEGLQ